MLAQSVVDESLGLTDVISPYIVVFFVAFIISFIMTPIARKVALRTNIVDKPGDLRKIHTEATPYLGGVAIFTGWLIAVGISFLVPVHFTNFPGVTSTVSFPFSVVLGAAVILLTGLLDDIYGIAPRMKIGGQFFAAAALASQDVGIRVATQAFAGAQNMLGNLPLPAFLDPLWTTAAPSWFVYIVGTLVIAFFVIGGCNSMNFIDGMDGLAAGVAAIAAMGFLLIAAFLAIRTIEGGDMSSSTAMSVMNDARRFVMCLAILGAVLGFLPFNFNPATIFMGDAGSLLLGYLCAATMLMFAQTDDNYALLAVTAGLIVFALPIADTSLAIFRRKMQGISMSSPDARHLHHLLRRSGLSVRQSVLSLYVVAIMFMLLGVMLIALDFRWRYVLAVAMVLYGFIFVTAYKFGLRYSSNFHPAKPAVAAAQAEADTATSEPTEPHLSQNPQASVSLDDDVEDEAKSS